MVMAAIYSLGMMQRTFFGRQQDTRSVPDLSNVAFGTVLFIAVLQIWLGLYPRTLFIATRPVMEMLVQPVLAAPHLTRPVSESFPSSNIMTSHVSPP
jgi:NADH-quinone oxidoreductase subunit M